MLMNTSQQGNKFRRLEDKQKKCRVRFCLSIREFVAKTYYVLKRKVRLGAGWIKKIQKGWVGDIKLLNKSTFLKYREKMIHALPY